MDSENGPENRTRYRLDRRDMPGKREVVPATPGRPAEEVKQRVKPAPMYHMTANSYLEFVDKDHARQQAYWLTSCGAVGQTTPARVAAEGREVDELVKVNGQWLIKVRDVTPKE